MGGTLGHGRQRLSILGQILALLWLLMICGGAEGATVVPSPVHSTASPPVTLVLFNREITELRGMLGGLNAAERVARAQARFAALAEADLGQPVSVAPLPGGETNGLTFQILGKPLFSLLPSDLDPESSATLDEAGEHARMRLEQAVAARRAQHELGVLVRGAGISLAVLLLCGLGLWFSARLQSRIAGLSQVAATDAATGMVAYLRAFAYRVLALAIWLVFVAFVYGAAITLLAAFPWSQPWSAQLADFVRQLGGWLVAGIMGAIPGLITILVVMLVARAIQDVLNIFIGHVQSGRIRVPFMHPDTAGATRRLLMVMVWGLAIAAAYPYLPGSGSDAFKGLSVLFGLMLTLGSTGLVTQLMSGLVVIYSRSLRKGDFVAINEIEGVVSEVGALAVKVVNMRNEEITVPNSVITGAAIRNYSKLAGHQGTLVSTKVTIGYDTPWRQVHAMLVAAASKTPGVRPLPSPFVYQRALSDFYVEYELFAHVDRPLERVPILSALHAAIQDEFNTYGVQIMSPHFYQQPAVAPVVPREKWFLDPAREVSTNP